MSSTRRAEAESEFHPNRYASSPEFERGLSAMLVAKRASMIRKAKDRELIWFLHYLSHQEGGLVAVTKHLVEEYSGHAGTLGMMEIGKGNGKNYSAEEVQKIRADLPRALRRCFPAKGETIRDRDPKDVFSPYADIAEQFQSAVPGNSYPVSGLQKLCIQAAMQPENGMTRLEKFLCRLCVDPSVSLDEGEPWYFVKLLDTLRDYLRDWTCKKVSSAVVTSLGQKIYDVLDYTEHSAFLSLTEGAARTGKTFSAKAWCEQHPGRARFVEVPTGNDESGFFRALARGLGLGNFLQYKATDIRERVQSVLLTGDLILVLDEAQRLWPQRNLRYGYPSRIVWVMAMANQGVPIGLIATPQFTVTQKAVEKNGWNGDQLTGRIYHYEALPAELSEADLTAVAKHVLPEADRESLRALVTYAACSARNLAAIGAISSCARYMAEKDGREKVTTEDIRRAMSMSVIPADTKLKNALRIGGKKTTEPLQTAAPVLEARDTAGRGRLTQEISTHVATPNRLAGSLLEA